MADAARIAALYEAYVDAVRTLERNRKPGEGIFGMRNGPAYDPCHDRFAADLEAAIADFAAEDPSPDETLALLERVFTVPSEYRDLKSAYWMLVAVHSLTIPLIGRLSPPDAAELRRRYAGQYRRWERLPAQDRVLDALKKQAAAE